MSLASQQYWLITRYQLVNLQSHIIVNIIIADSIHATPMNHFVWADRWLFDVTFLCVFSKSCTNLNILLMYVW